MSAPGPLYRVARLREVVEEARETRTFVLDATVAAEPGQFLMLWVPRLDEKPFCVAGAVPLSVTVRKVGPLTEALFDLVPGDRVWFRGPLGRGFALTGRRVLAVGGGYGAAPLGFLCRRAREAGIAAVLASGARTAADLLVPRAAASYAAGVHTATEDGSAGRRGRVTDVAASLLAGGSFDALYACGPKPMLEATAALAREARVPCELSLEAYMRCGVGVCGSCEHDGLLVCSDGPVFAFDAAGKRR